MTETITLRLSECMLNLSSNWLIYQKMLQLPANKKIQVDSSINSQHSVLKFIAFPSPSKHLLSPVLRDSRGMDGFFLSQPGIETLKKSLSFL